MIGENKGAMVKLYYTSLIVHIVSFLKAKGEQNVKFLFKV